MDALGFRTLAPDTNPDAGEPWRQVLREGACLIERDGWWRAERLDQRNETNGRCAITSMCGDDGVIEAVAAFAASLGHTGRAFGAQKYIIAWNDAPGRTAAEVCEALRQCAQS